MFDADPWLLNAPNGTLDLRTGELRPHRREDYITKLVPDSRSTRPPRARPGRRSCDRIFAGDAELIGFVRRLVGYALTGVDDRARPAGLLAAAGANGKSHASRSRCWSVLGPDYAMKAPPDLLMARPSESHPTERADLFGKRLVAAIETEDGSGSTRRW